MASRSNKPYIGDIGTIILLDVGQDITGATVANIKVKLPDETETEWIGSVYDEKYVKYVILGPGSGYQTCGMNIISTDDSGLTNDTSYTFKINDTEYTITTGAVGVITYADVVNLMDAEVDADGFDVIISSNDIRVDNRLTGEESVVNLADGDTNGLFSNIIGFTEFSISVDPFLGNFGQAGIYNLQAYVEINSWKGRGETVELKVYKKFK